MGLFDFLGKKKQDDTGSAAASRRAPARDVARLARLAGDKMAQNYDRQEAIEDLGKQGTSEAAEGLLRRFGFTMEPSITDQEEKESAAEGIVRAGEEAIEPIRRYCAKAESLTWALKVLRRIVPEERMVTELLGLLEQFDTEYLRNPEPKIQLIAALEEFRSDAVRQAVEPFLGDVNESVRFHAASTLFAVDAAPSIPALILAMTEEESLRVKNRIASGIAEKRWTVPEASRDACDRALPPDFSLEGETLHRRG